MQASLRAFLTNIIDYAGLFPPAQLPLDPAIRNYARYRFEAEAWMLGRFICASEKLPALAPYGDELFSQAPPFRFSVLGRSGEGVADFLERLHRDAGEIEAFRDVHGNRVAVECFETRLPVSALPVGGSAGAVYEIVHGAVQALRAAGLPAAEVYFEVGADEHFDARVRLLGAALADYAPVAAEAGWPPVGLKLRCGGTTPAAFPSVERLATALAARPAGVPLKFTAGLHHPVRHFDRGLQTPMHGFLNVFAAALLAERRELRSDTIAAILSDEAADAFRFTRDGFAWRELALSTDEVIAGRRSVATSFGSCSFDEPREDLRGLGLL